MARIVTAGFVTALACLVMAPLLALGSYSSSIPAGRGTGFILEPSETLVAMVLTNRRLTIYEAGRADIAAGTIDARVLAILQAAAERWTLAVSSLRSGHSRCVGGGDYEGCVVSNHWHGRGVDVYEVDGLPVSASNRSAAELVTWLLTLESDVRPDEIGHPWPALTGWPGSFSDPAHTDHVHIGWSAKPVDRSSSSRITDP